MIKTNAVGFEHLMLSQAESNGQHYQKWDPTETQAHNGLKQALVLALGEHPGGN